MEVHRAQALVGGTSHGCRKVRKVYRPWGIYILKARGTRLNTSLFIKIKTVVVCLLLVMKVVILVPYILGGLLIRLVTPPVIYSEYSIVGG